MHKFKQDVVFGAKAKFVGEATFDHGATYETNEVATNLDSDLSLSTGVAKLVKVIVAHVASVVNQVKLIASAAGNAIEVAAVGTDTDIGIKLTPKGAGLVLPQAAVKLKSYNVAGLPAAAAGNAGALVYVTDGDAGAKCLAMSDGTNWKVISLGATASAT